LLDNGKIPLVLTRPAEAATQFVRAMPETLQQVIEVVYTPLTKYEVLPNNDIHFWLNAKRYDALMFSSGYGVKAFYDVASSSKNLPDIVFTVGEDTAKQYQFYSHSYKNGHFAADGDMKSMLELIASRNRETTVLYPCARDLAPNTIPLIEQSPLKVDIVPIYQMVKVGSAGFNAALSQVKGRAIIPFFSARNAQIFTEFIEAQDNQFMLRDMVAVAISQNVKKQIEHLPWLDILCCFKPGRNEMYSALNIGCESFR
jgi:uroporphyrinogen-III synthase